MSILIKDGWLVLNDDKNSVIKDGYVYLENDRIQEVGENGSRVLELEKMATEVISAKGKIVLPGLVNAHTHLFQTFMRGLADHKPLFNWLKEDIWPTSTIMEDKDFYLSGLLGCLENLKTGATSVIDQHYVHTLKSSSDQIFKAMEESGIRGTLCRCFTSNCPEKGLCEENEVVLEQVEKNYKEWHGKDNERLSLSIGPLNPWTVDPKLVVDTKEFARKHKLKYQIHTAETTSVVQGTLDLFGRRNVDFFNDLGIMDEDTQLAHAVYLNALEMEIVKNTGAMVVHNPVANMYLASGVAPVPQYRKMGIPVAIATDGPGSNNSQDMLGTLKFTACLHKVHTLNAQILLPEDVLDMVLNGGAKAMGRDDLGVLSKGMKADIILVDWQKAHIAPVHNPISALVYNATGNDVDTVLVDGKVVIRNKKAEFVDEVALIEECQDRIAYLKKKKDEKYS